MRLIVFVSLIVAARAHSSNAGSSGPSNSQPLESSPSNAPICPSGGEPVCATNGREYIYFENGCHLDAHNYKQLFAGKPSLLQTATSNCFVDCSQKVCLAVYEPVCANQYGTSITKTFGNKCQVNLEICSTKTRWTIIYEGPCVQDRKCSKSCSTEYKPVCAAYNYQERTFSNECELVKLILQTKQDWRIVHEGHCDQALCIHIYQPICASLNGNLQTFPNQCVLDNEIKSSGNAWQIVYEGGCQSASSTSSNNGKDAIAAAGTYGKVTNPSEKPGATTPSNRYAPIAAPGKPQYKNGVDESVDGSSAINGYGQVPYSNQPSSAQTPSTASTAGIIPSGLNQEPAASEPSILPAPTYAPVQHHYGKDPSLPSGAGASETNGYVQQPAAPIPSYSHAPVSAPSHSQYKSGSASNPSLPHGADASTTNGYELQPSAPALTTGPAPKSAPGKIPYGLNKLPGATLPSPGIAPVSQPGKTQFKNGADQYINGASATNGYGQQPAAPTSAPGQPKYGSGSVLNPHLSSGFGAHTTIYGNVQQPAAPVPLILPAPIYSPKYSSASVPQVVAGSSAPNGYELQPAAPAPNTGPAYISTPGQPQYGSGSALHPSLPYGAGAPATNGYGQQPAAPALSTGLSPISAPGQIPYGSNQQPGAALPYIGPAPVSQPSQTQYINGAASSPANHYGQVPNSNQEYPPSPIKYT